MGHFVPNGGGSGGGGGFSPPSGGGGSAGKGPLTTQLITSTGGLIGTSGLLMAPALNPNTGKPYIIVFDSTNLNCEEPGEYDFRQECNYGEIPGEGRTCTIHLIMLKYRELGYAKFSVNVTVYNRTEDDFETVQIPVSIPQKTKLTAKRQKSFPDNRIHTIYLTPPRSTIQGERPQVTITRNANSGPLDITKLTLCGNADEKPQG